MIRHDRALLAPPVQRRDGIEFEGVAARVHGPGDGLPYPEFRRVEYRDMSELRKIVDQLPGKPIVVGHPAGGKVGKATHVIGRVISARVDGEYAVARMRIDTDEARGMLAVGLHELSLGYDVGLDSRNYQRETEVDHLAVVPMARCGGQCSIRTDCAGQTACPCASARGMQNSNPYPQGMQMPDQNKTPNTDEALRALEAQRADAQARATELEQTAASEKSRADAAEGRVEALKQENEELRAKIAAGATAAETEAIAQASARADAAEASLAQVDAKIAARVKERVSLERAAEIVLGREFRCDGLSDREVMATAVKKLDVGADISASVSDDKLRGKFEALVERHGQQARNIARVAEVTAQTQRVDARAEVESKRRNQWKQPLPSSQFKKGL